MYSNLSRSLLPSHNSFEGEYPRRAPPSRRRLFYERHLRLWDWIESEFGEAFWVELGDLLIREREARYTTRGAVVRDPPATADMAVQTSRGRRHVGLQVRPSARDISLQAGPRTTDVGTQVTREPECDARRPRATSTASRSTARAPLGTATGLNRAPARGSSPPDRADSNRCRGCGSAAHRARDCPLRGNRLVCYRCGRPNVSVRTCPRCGDGWERSCNPGPVKGGALQSRDATGPYARGRGRRV